MRRFTKKAIVAVVGVTALAVGAGGAYAYWTTTGSGTGSAQAATTASITVVQTGAAITNLGPNVTPAALAGNFNNAGTTKVYVTAVTVSISSVVKAVGAPAGTCDATDYVIAYSVGSTMPVGAEIAVGTGVGAWSGATLAFNNKATNQDACKLATVNLAYASS